MEYSTRKKVILIIASLIVRWVGVLIGVTGLVMALWFCFISKNQYHYYFSIIFTMLAYVGFVILKFGHEQMYNENDRFR